MDAVACNAAPNIEASLGRLGRQRDSVRHVRQKPADRLQFWSLLDPRRVVDRRQAFLAWIQGRPLACVVEHAAAVIVAETLGCGTLGQQHVMAIELE
jgi:hypothetical protein